MEKLNPKRVSNIKMFINKYKWKGINYLSKYMIGKRLRKVIKQFLLIFLCIKEKEIYPDYISEINLTCEKQIVILTIPNEETKGWNYFVVKKYQLY